MIRVSFEEVEAMNRRRDEINAVRFQDIEWTKDGKPFLVTAEQADEWRFIGLSNASFVEFHDGITL